MYHDYAYIHYGLSENVVLCGALIIAKQGEIRVRPLNGNYFQLGCFKGIYPYNLQI